MATRKHASPRRRNPSFRPRSKRVTLTGRKGDLIKWVCAAETSPVGLCGHAEEENAADGQRLHHEGRHEELGGECSTLLRAFHGENARFCGVLLLNVYWTQPTLQTRQKAYFSCSLVACLYMRTCCISTNQRRKPPPRSAGGTSLKAVRLFYVRSTTGKDMFGRFVV